MCCICLQLQLVWFRNEIKERWNQLNNDGKVGQKVEIPLKLNPAYPMEMAATIMNGNAVCVTHILNTINQQIEVQSAMQNKPRIQPAQGNMDGFLKRGN